MSSLYSIGLMNRLANALEADNYTEDQVNSLMSRGRLTSMKAVLEERATITMFQGSPEVKVPHLRLRLISAGHKLTIPALDGKRTIARAKTTFTWGIDVDFTNWGLNVEGPATSATNAEVHEMVKDGNFADIYGGTGRDLDKLVLTQDQVISFVETYKKWLRTEESHTFFLLKHGDEFFVAGVCVVSGGSPYASVDRFSLDFVWCAEFRHRFVIPQQTLKS